MKKYKIIYDDQDLLVVCKFAGLAVQSARVSTPDLMSLLRNEMLERGEKKPYLGLVNRLDQRVIKYLKEADGAFTNAEFCTPTPDTPPASGRGYMTSVRADRLDELADLNLKLISFVNNHSGDYGW